MQQHEYAQLVQRINVIAQRLIDYRQAIAWMGIIEQGVAYSFWRNETPRVLEFRINEIQYCVHPDDVIPVYADYEYVIEKRQIPLVQIQHPVFALADCFKENKLGIYGS